MTDKVQKIREEVERIINRRLNLINGDYFDLNEETNGLTNEIIDTIELLQEEPVPQFKVGDTIRSKHWETAVHKIISMDDKSYCLDNGGKVDISSQQLWEFVKEPVSEEWIEELRTKLDSMSKEDFKKIFDKYAIAFKEEPVSEELEEAAHQYYEPNDKFMDGFKKGAKWQKKKDLELTLEDIRIILDSENDILRECNSQKELVIETYPKGEDYYGEILKRFKERKETKD